MNEKFERKRHFFEDRDIRLTEEHLEMSIPDEAFQNEEFVELLNEFIRAIKNYDDILSKGDKDEIMKIEKDLFRIEDGLKKELKKIPNTRPQLN